MSEPQSRYRLNEPRHANAILELREGDFEVNTSLDVDTLAVLLDLEERYAQADGRELVRVLAELGDFIQDAIAEFLPEGEEPPRIRLYAGDVMQIIAIFVGGKSAHREVVDALGAGDEERDASDPDEDEDEGDAGVPLRRRSSSPKPSSGSGRRTAGRRGTGTASPGTTSRSTRKPRAA